MEKKNKAPADSLETRFSNLSDGLKLGLMELLGRPLSDVVEGKNIDTPIGFMKLDLFDKSLGFTKHFGKNYQVNFDLNKKNPDPFFRTKDDYRLTFKKEF